MLKFISSFQKQNFNDFFILMHEKSSAGNKNEVIDTFWRLDKIDGGHNNKFKIILWIAPIF